MAPAQWEYLRTSIPTAEVLLFASDPSVVAARGWKSAPERLSIRPGITPVAPIELSPAAVDGFIADVARYYGHDKRQINGSTISLKLRLTRPDVPDREVVLKVTVRRERRGSGFVARADVSKAFGGGETIGEAFIDCVNDLTERVRVFEAERDCLGPGPQQELGEIHRWLGVAS
ncbi:MAG: hypothetical protein ACR2JY_15905 [Chloroflexota bacterium]